jgi:hypothetical protein
VSDLDVVLTGMQSDVGYLISRAERCGANWTTAPAPGKWSPSQIVEHVARALDESSKMVSGAPSKFPVLPKFLRPILKALILRRILSGRRFPKARAIKAFDPATGPASPADGRKRLEDAMARFDRTCRAQAVTGREVLSTVFGPVTVEEYARFQGLHARHHAAQIAEAA